VAGTAEDKSGDAARRRMQGQRSLYGRHACLLATKGPMATSLGACAGLGRSARQGEARNRLTVQGATRDRRGVSWHVAGGDFEGDLGARGA
jgi:hypothetical protein